MSHRLMLAVLTASLLIGAAPAARGQESPAPAESCQAGELCVREEVDDRFRVNRGPVNDPPGAYVRSLVTLGLIVSLVGTYLVAALTGHNPLGFIVRRRSRKSAPGRT